MKRAMKVTISIFAVLIFLLSLAWAQEPPPQDQQQASQTQPSRNVRYTNDSVAHLSYVEGKTFVQRASDLGYEEGVLNTPISEGDRLGTTDGRAEVLFGRGNYIRLDNNTKLDILNLPKKDDDISRFRVWSGNIYLIVARLNKEKSIEVHTADSSFYILDKGIYRIDVRENKDTEIMVYRGLVEAAGEEGSTLVKDSQKLEISEGRFSGKPTSFMAAANDSFDKFNESRDAITNKEFAQRHLPSELEGYESELDENGQWTYLAPYGDVWVPSGVGPDWRPYYDGRWVWLGLTGWTWLPYEPWGWATFHYGRWHWGVGLGWYWIPTSLWGPGWVDWWWDDYYCGWAPLSFWGYPVVVIGGGFYGGYYGRFYPVGSRALTVINRNQLKAPNASLVALRDPATLKNLTRMSLDSRTLNLQPAATRISVQPLNGRQVMLTNSGESGPLGSDRAIGRGSPAAAGSSNSNQKNSTSAPKIKRESTSSGRSSSSARSSGSSKGESSGARKIRKKEEGPMSSAEMSSRSYPGSAATSSNRAATVASDGLRIYPSSPLITRPESYGGAARSRSFIDRITGWSGRYSGRSSSGRTSSGRVSSRGSSGRSGSWHSSGSHSSGGHRR